MRRALAWLCVVAMGAGCAPVDGDTPATGTGEDAETPAPPDDAAIDWTGYRAGGNEPFWWLRFEGGRMSFEHIEVLRADAPRPEAERTATGFRFAAVADGQPFLVEIGPGICYDSMSGIPRPDDVTVTVHGQTYRGCGGETADLLTGGEWRIATLDGAPTPAGFAQTIAFDDEGAVLGNGGCNRYRARYELTGEGLTLGPIAATRRACVNGEWNGLEARLFTLLGEITHFSISDRGELELHATGDEPAIVARR